MSKQPIIKKQQLSFMASNFIAFTVIFSIFSVIVFTSVQTTLFSKADEDLLRLQERIQLNPEWEMRPKPSETPPDEKNARAAEPDLEPLNPRVIVLHWNEDGAIVNENEIGTLLYENYFEEYALDAALLNEITGIAIEEQYHFRSLLFETEEGGYTQLLVNVDAEQTIISNFGKLLLICSIVFILLSISASYLLSKKMMKPIIDSWNKQTEFVENASHELRTPLTIIQNKLELLLTAPQEKIITKFENIALSLSETRRLSKMTSDLLTLARADSADVQINKQPLHINTFIKGASAPYMEIAESQNKYFWMDLQSNGHVKADETRLHQLIIILLDNALKYTNKGDSIGLKTYEDDQRMIIEVTDTGPGIKKENLPYIFDRFYREDKARARETGGSGLGLSIARWIVQQHSGTISAKQTGEQGTTFKIKLPK